MGNISFAECRLAKLYGFPVFGLTSEEKLALQLASPSIEAEDIIRNHSGSLTADQLYDLTLEATGSKSAAERAFLARRNAELRSGQQVSE